MNAGDFGRRCNGCHDSVSVGIGSNASRPKVESFQLLFALAPIIR